MIKLQGGEWNFYGGHKQFALDHFSIHFSLIHTYASKNFTVQLLMVVMVEFRAKPSWLALRVQFADQRGGDWSTLDQRGWAQSR